MKIIVHERVRKIIHSHALFNYNQNKISGSVTAKTNSAVNNKQSVYFVPKLTLVSSTNCDNQIVLGFKSIRIEIIKIYLCHGAHFALKTIDCSNLGSSCNSSTCTRAHLCT